MSRLPDEHGISFEGVTDFGKLSDFPSLLLPPVRTPFPYLSSRFLQHAALLLCAWSEAPIMSQNGMHECCAK